MFSFGQSSEPAAGLRILIADDEPTHLFVLEMFLRKWGYDVVSTDNGAEAWRILQQADAPRLAILDWEMPGLTGVEICRRVRSASAQPYTFLIMLTARAQKTDIRQGLEAGADTYLTKPFDPGELREYLAFATRVLELRESAATICH